MATNDSIRPAEGTSPPSIKDEFAKYSSNVHQVDALLRGAIALLSDPSGTDPNGEVFSALQIIEVASAMISSPSFYDIDYRLLSQIEALEGGAA